MTELTPELFEKIYDEGFKVGQATIAEGHARKVELAEEFFELVPVDSDSDAFEDEVEENVKEVVGETLSKQIDQICDMIPDLPLKSRGIKTEHDSPTMIAYSHTKFGLYSIHWNYTTKLYWFTLQTKDENFTSKKTDSQDRAYRMLCDHYRNQVQSLFDDIKV